MRKRKLLATMMTGILLVSNTVPALAADISVTGDTTGQTPTEFVVDEEALGGGLTVTIPASLTLIRDGETGDYGVEDVVSAQGNMNPSKKLQVSTDLSIEYTNTDDTSITVNGAVTFGTDGMEEWTAAETKASIDVLDSRAIGVAVAGTDVEYVGTYQTIVEFDINVVDAVEAQLFTYSTTETEATITGLTTQGEQANALIIPSEYNGLPVTTVADYTLRNAAAKSIYVPASITSLGSKSIGVVDTLIVDENNTVYDSRNDCNAIIETATNTLVFGSNNAVIPSDVTSIGAGAFYRADFETIEIPTGVASIGAQAFADCPNLTTIKIPTSVTSIGFGAFGGSTNLTSVTYNEVEYTSLAELTTALETAGVTFVDGNPFNDAGLAE